MLALSRQTCSMTVSKVEGIARPQSLITFSCHRRNSQDNHVDSRHDVSEVEQDRDAQPGVEYIAGSFEVHDKGSAPIKTTMVIIIDPRHPCYTLLANAAIPTSPPLPSRFQSIQTKWRCIETRRRRFINTILCALDTTDWLHTTRIASTGIGKARVKGGTLPRANNGITKDSLSELTVFASSWRRMVEESATVAGPVK